MKRRLSAVSAWVLLAGGLVVIATNVALGANPSPSPNFSAYASGTAVHADVLQTGPLGAGMQLLGAEAAFSGAALHNGGASTGQIVNEMAQEVQPNLPGAAPDLPGQIAYGMGDGLAVNIGQNVPVLPPPTIPLTNPARVSDGHTPAGVKTEELATIPGSPLIYADLLRGQADATKDATACGDNPFGQGLGRVANAQLLDTGTALPGGQLGAPVVSVASTQPDRGAVQSRSTTQLVPLGDHKGVTSEVRETFAPVTLFKNTPMQVTIELLGEWVLSTTAGGTNGSASFHYGPEPAPPTTPILRVIQGYPNPTATKVLNFDDFTSGGLPQHLIPGNPLIDVWLNESPRTIGSSDDANPPAPAVAANGTSAAAAVDVVRAKVLQNTVPGVGGHVADVRIGHMESRVAVPVGGIPCPAPTTLPPTTAPPTTAGPTTTAPPTPCVGWATGTDVHADALQTGLPPTGMQVLNAEVAFSGASARTSGSSPRLVNEMQQEVQPALPFTGTPADPKLGGSLAYGRGSGLEVGLGQTLPANNPTIPVNKVALSAPPNQEETADPANIPAAPLLSASLLRGHAKVSSDGSQLKNPSGQGDGYAADVSLLDTGASMVNPLPTPLVSTSSNTPDRATVQSTSTSKLVPFGDHFGIVSEVRETIAPVTLFKNTPMQTTIEVLGEWVLTVTANGTGATAIHYGPDPKVTAPTTPVIRVSQGWPL
ncbi:MAG: hypothetical protein JOY57_05750, partial [Actinobacteria bacterium]|nr:hypothetical protein [Actinomycetota bacterium]